jgi:TonB family protein
MLCRLIVSVLLIGVLCMTAKNLVLPGWHDEIVSTDQPREEFTVGEYVVVAHSPGEDNEDVEFLYEFAVTKDAKQVGLVHLEKHEGIGYLLCYKYFDKNMECIEKNRSVYSSQYGSLFTMEMYRDRPNYDELKYNIVAALTGSTILTYSMNAEDADSIVIELNPNGIWLPWIYSADGVGQYDVVLPYMGTRDSALIVPRFITVSTVRIQLEDDGTWTFSSSELLEAKNTDDSLLFIQKAYLDFETVPFHEIESKPRIIEAPTPVYPELARRAGIEGTAVTKALIDIDGAVVVAKIAESSDCALLDFEALRCMMMTTFTPAIQFDKKVRVWVSRPVVFRITGQERQEGQMGISPEESGAQ